MTGINAITLRAWERRYGLIMPQRTASGRRVYSQADVDCIKEVLVLMEKGIPIGQMSKALQVQDKTPEIFVKQAMSIWQKTLSSMIEAIAAFDEVRLEHLYNEILALYPIDLTTERLLLPLLSLLGERWAAGLSEAPVSEEHFFAVYLKNKLGARFHHTPANNQGPVLLAACLPGELHEICLLLFCLTAREHGYQVILLGADMPLDELPITAKHCQANAVVLSGSVAPSKQLIKHELPTLCTKVNVPVFIGGTIATSHTKILAATGAAPISGSINAGLQTIGKYLKRTGTRRHIRTMSA